MTESLPAGTKRTPSYYTVWNTAAELQNSEPAGNLAGTLGNGITEPGTLWMRIGGQWVQMASVDPSQIPPAQPVEQAPQATETIAGKAEIATQAETDAGTDNIRIVTPAKLAGRQATNTLAGIVEKATTAETTSGASDTGTTGPLYISPTAYKAVRDSVTSKVKSYVRMHKTSNQSVSNGVGPVALTWQAAAFNIGGGADTANNRFVVPSGMAGLWRVRVELSIDGATVTAGAVHQIRLLVNGTQVDAENTLPGGSRALTLRLGHEDSFAVGDLLTTTLSAVGNTSSALTVLSGTNESVWVLEYMGPTT